MRLKTKLVLAISGMVVALVAIFSYFYVSRLVRQRIYEAYDSADFVAKEIRESARAASLANLGSSVDALVVSAEFYNQQRNAIDDVVDSVISESVVR